MFTPPLSDSGDGSSDEEENRNSYRSESESESQDSDDNDGDAAVTTAFDQVERLKEIIRLNPYIGEPWLLLGDEYFRRRDFSKAYFCSVKAILKFIQMGTAWDKRYSFGSFLS